MKNSLLYLFAAFVITSCSTDAPEGQQETGKEEHVTVGVSLGGELAVRESPLKSGGEASTKTADEAASTDLFGIQIYDAVNDIPYALVVGDDISKINFELKKDWEYDIEMTYIKDGQNLIERWSGNENRFWAPFSGGSADTELNKVYYGTSNELFGLNSGQVDLVNSDDMYYVPVDRYYGISKNITVAETSGAINLNLKRTVFGITLNIDLGVKNNIEQVTLDFIEPGHNTIYYIYLTEGKGSIEIPLLSLGVSSNYAIKDGYEEEFRLALGTEDQNTRFFSETLNVKRNTMHHITFIADINDGSGVESNMADVKFSLEETEMDDVYVDFSEEE